jgi:hypothetical protein
VASRQLSGVLAVVGRPDGELEAISWGTPNAAGYSREMKQSAYRRMAGFLRARSRPVVLGVDTNTWGDPPAPSGNLLSADPDWIDEHRFVDATQLTVSLMSTGR